MVEVRNQGPRIGHTRIIAFCLMAFASGGLIIPFINTYLVEAGITAIQLGMLPGWSALAVAVIAPLIGLAGGIAALDTLPGYFAAERLIRRKDAQTVLVICFGVVMAYLAG